MVSHFFFLKVCHYNPLFHIQEPALLSLVQNFVIFAIGNEWKMCNQSENDLFKKFMVFHFTGLIFLPSTGAYLIATPLLGKLGNIIGRSVGVMLYV